MALSMDIIKQSFSFFMQHIIEISWKIIPLILVTSYLSNLLIAWLDFGDGFLDLYYAIVIKSNFFAIPIVLFVILIQHKVYELPTNFSQLFMRLVYKLPYIIVLTTIATTLMYLAAFMLIFPALILALRFSYAWIYLIFDNYNPIKALWTSFNETKGEWTLLWQNMLVVTIISLISGIVLFIVSAIFLDDFFISWVMSIFFNMAFLFVQVILYRIYSEFGKDNVDH